MQSQKVKKTLEQIKKEHREAHQNFLRESEILRQKNLKKIHEEAEGAIDKIIDIRDNSKDQYALDAAKYLLKMSGYEIDQVEVSGANGGPMIVEVTSAHAKRVREAACR